MRTTVALDDELIEQARFYVGPLGTAELLRQALTALIQREAAQRLARMGGTEPQLEYIRRRRPKPA